MTDEQTAANPEYDDNGKPIIPVVETKEVSEGEGAEPQAGAEVKDEDIDNPEIPVRSSIASHIIARKNEQIKKLRSQQEKDDEAEVEEDELSPVAQKAIDRRLSPVMDMLTTKAEEDELQALYAAEPEAKGYAKRIKAYMGDPNWKAIPPSAIYHHLAFEKAAAAGAKRKVVADKEADQMRGAGTTHRPSETNTTGIPTAEEMAGLDDAAFEALQNKARAGHFVR